MMKNILLLSLLFLLPQYASGLAEANDLDLNGASITDFAQSGEFVFATSESPRGIYVSGDFGTNWNFASGGEYNLGSGQAVEAVGSKIFAILSNRLYVSEASLTPSWTEVDIGLAPAVENTGGQARALLDEEALFSLASDGNFLFAASNHGVVRVVNPDDLSVLSSGTPLLLVDPTSLSSLAVDPTTEHLWVIVGEVGEQNSILFRCSYNISTGQLGTFSDKTPALVKAASSRMGGVFSNQNGILYVTTFGASSDYQGIYRSSDAGESFNRIVPAGADSAGLNIRAAAFSGATHLVGTFFSSDSGANFLDGRVGETPQGDLQNQRALLIDQSNPEKALATAANGPIATSNLSNGPASTWGQRFAGLRGIRINDLQQSATDPAVVVLALEGGLARTDNFSDDPEVLESQPIIWNYPILLDGVSTPVFSVSLDPDDNNIVYAGTGSFFMGTFSGNNASWTKLLAEETPAKNIVDISIAGQKILLATAQVSGGLDGNVRVFNRNSMSLEALQLDGLPVSAVYAISEQIMYAGVGGKRSLEPSASENGNRGLYRSLDGGTSWQRLTKNEDLNSSGISELEYDSTKDILYVSALSQGETDDTDGDSGDDDIDQDDGDEDPLPNLFIIRGATKENIKISTPEIGLPDGDLTALAFASKDGSRRLYAAVDGDIFVSDSEANTWALFYDGSSEEQIHVLLFDELIRGSNVGFDGLSGKPNLIVSKISKSVSSNSKSKITVNFNRGVESRREAKRKIKAQAGRSLRTTTRISQDGSKASIFPRNGSWPTTGKVRVRIKPDLQTEELSEAIDSDYDGLPGGKTYTRKISVR